MLGIKLSQNKCTFPDDFIMLILILLNRFLFKGACFKGKRLAKKLGLSLGKDISI